MANRYWVGGTAAWDGTAGTKWALTSGGAGGQAVPTASDDVFFDAASGAVTCTISSGNTGAKSINCTGFTGTLAGGIDITVAGSVTLVTGMTFSYTGGLTLSGTGTLTSAGKTFTGGGITINGVGITVTLGDAASTAFNLVVTNGTFTTNNYNVTAAALSSSNSNTRTINLGSSTVTLSGGGTNPIAFTTNTGLTFNAGTSQINLSGSSPIGISTGTLATTFYNVAVTNASATNFTLGAATSGTLTFNNLALIGPSSAGVNNVIVTGPSIVVNGTLSTSGTAGNRRVWLRSATYGIAQTLTINSAPSLTDADFRDLYVIGTSAPISGTRIGNLRGCSGITFDVAKTVYWNLAAGGNWSANAWAATSGGGVSTDNFPLAQDTAVIENTGLNTSATVNLDSAITYIGTLSATTRTSAATIQQVANYTCYGDFALSANTTLSVAATMTFSGRNVQTITSAGKTFQGGGVTIDTYGGTVQLADALTVGTGTLTVTNGTFDTKNYNVTAGALFSNSSSPRVVSLGSSTVTLSASTNTVIFDATNLTFNSGTSTITCSGTTTNLGAAGQTFNNLSYTTTTATTHTISTGTFNNITITAPASAGLMQVSLGGNNTINGTLTCAGATAVRRIFVRSDTLGTTRTLTVNTLSATDCDFRDITIAGTAAGSSPTRAGNCGGNTGITFPAAKTVYAIGDGSGSNLSLVGWATSSGGTINVNNLPLAQDIAIVDNSTSAPSIAFAPLFNIGTFDTSLRTSAVTLNASAGNMPIYGDFKCGSGVTFTSAGNPLVFSKRGTQTITSNGISFGCNVTIDNFSGTVQLADALTLISARTLTLTSGTFDAVTYNVTVGNFSASGSALPSTLKMGSGAWTLTASGLTPWNMSASNFTFYKGTANISMAIGNQFSGGGLSYNKLTLTGSTAGQTSFITGNNQFTELASTVTIAHTINFGTASQTFGAWTVTGTAGNVVTLSGTATLTIAGARVSGVDYLALGTTTMSTTSPAEFYAGANSTGGTRFILTAAPAAVTRYWRGGTGTWDATTTTNWSDTSGGSGGFSVPTSADAVIFDSLSNATGYTVTCTATQLRCGSLTMAGPLTGNVTWAGTAPLAIHSNVSLAATGITRTYTGTPTFSGSTTGKTITTNGVTLAGNPIVNGVGCGWTLGSALSDGGAGSTVTVTNGSFDTGNYAVTYGALSSTNSNTRSLSLGSSTITIQAFPGGFTNNVNLTFNAGTSNIVFTSATTSNFGGLTFYNATFTFTFSPGTMIINGANTFNNVTVTPPTSAGLNILSFSANQTINGTLTLSAGTNATMRTFLQSNTLGTTRTLTVNAFSGTDADFRDITVTGAAAPISGTRLGDCKGNSGITFGAGVTRYWNLAAGGNWSAVGWAATSGGSPAVNNFPLAQDTALFESTGLNSGATITINAAYNIGTINMSARTSNTMTLAVSSSSTIYGNWINGIGTTLSGTSTLTFAGRSSQTITNAGRTFTQPFVVNSPSGSLTLQDAFTSSNNTATAFVLTNGTLNANGFNFTLSGASSSFDASNSNTRTIALGSGTWTLAGSSAAWSANTSTNLTVTGAGTVSLTSASAKTFAGGGISYSGITLNQGGAGALTITGNNTFGNITNTYSATGATNITLGTTTQTVSSFTATGTVGKVLTIQGSSASSPATLIFSGTGVATTPTTDYLAITGVRAYNLATTWYAGANSTNNGSLGWIFAAAPSSAINVFISETATASDVNRAVATFRSFLSEIATGTDTPSAKVVFNSSTSDTATASDNIAAARAFYSAISELVTGTDTVVNVYTARPSILETATATDSVNAPGSTYNPRITETATATDVISCLKLLFASVAESATVSDAVQAALIFNRLIAEIATATDAVSTKYTTKPSILETATATDTENTKVTLRSAVSETATATDTIAALRRIFTVVSESATISDAIQTVVAFNRLIAEAASAADAVNAPGSTYNPSLAETATATDSVNTNATMRSAVTETATITDTVAPRKIASPVILETATVTDLDSAKQTFAALLAEAAASSDVVLVAPSTFNAPVLEAATATDTPRAAVVFRSFFADAALVFDTMGGAYLWNPIDDSQTANWQNINNTQTPGWTSINDTQTPGWTDIFTPNN